MSFTFSKRHILHWFSRLYTQNVDSSQKNHFFPIIFCPLQILFTPDNMLSSMMALSRCFFISTTYSKSRSFQYVRIVLRVTGPSKLAFKSVAILLALRRESPLTSLFKWRISRRETFFERSIWFKSSSPPSCLYWLMAFCMQHLETLGYFEIWSWLRRSIM